jgi:hypothetical protein
MGIVWYVWCYEILKHFSVTVYWFNIVTPIISSWSDQHQNLWSLESQISSHRHPFNFQRDKSCQPILWAWRNNFIAWGWDSSTKVKTVLLIVCFPSLLHCLCLYGNAMMGWFSDSFPAYATNLFLDGAGIPKADAAACVSSPQFEPKIGPRNS